MTHLSEMARQGFPAKEISVIAANLPAKLQTFLSSFKLYTCSCSPQMATLSPVIRDKFLTPSGEILKVFLTANSKHLKQNFDFVVTEILIDKTVTTLSGSFSHLKEVQ